MNRIGAASLLGLVSLLWMPRSIAEDERFAVRFGLILSQPTAELSYLDQSYELQRSFGFEVDFEWYALGRLGLEGSMAFAFDANIESEADFLAGVSLLPLTVGLNGHIVKGKTLDWSIGVVGGVIVFTDIDIDSQAMTGMLRSTTEPTYGIQTSLDVSFAGRWGMNFGVKYLNAEMELEELPPIPFDPVIVRVMGLYRW